MPLNHTIDPAELSTLKDVEEDFVIFYASRDASGRMWCPDCLAVEDVVENTFGPAAAPTALAVYVGQKAEWKSSSNPFRGEPWKVESIPTIIRTTDGARLVDAEIKDRLASFLRE